MTTHSAKPRSDKSESRDVRKSRTRRALLDATLDRLSGEQSFTSLSLREVTKDAGVVPAAFYRHFPTMEALGLVLVEESFSTLRVLMRDVRAKPAPTRHVIRASVDTFLGYALEHDRHFRFIAKERYGGSTTLRLAIRQEVRLFTSELATDLARVPRLTQVSTNDLLLLASLVVRTVSEASEFALDTRPDDTWELERIAADASRQLSMVLLGASSWRSDIADRGVS